MNKKKEIKNNVLSFHQPAEFFIKKAEKQIDAGNFLEALQLYRQVSGMEPDNVEYLLCIAQIYSEMGLYAESNDVLHKIIRRGSTPTECLFALGCNYMGLKYYRLAEEAFEQYLAIDPDGEYSEDIEDFFTMFEEEEEDMLEESVLRDVNKSILAENAIKGKEHLDKGEYKKAIECLEKVTNSDSSLISAANNLALSYFFDSKKAQAIEVSKKVLLSQPFNLHACCNLAMFYSHSGDQESAMKYLEKLDNLKDIEPHDMHKVALTYCELGIHQKAYQWFYKIASYQPYDIRILHFCGLSAYNCGAYADSLSLFLKILKIDPKNSVAWYYKNKAETAKNNGAGKTLEYVYQVQFDEIKSRIKYLNECLKQKDNSLTEKWERDERFQSIILWGLHFGDEYIKKIVLEIMSIFSDEKVENEFRDFLLKSTESDEIKNDVFMYLKRMNAEEPYVAFINGAIAEVRVGSVSEDIENLPKPYIETLNIFVKNARSRYDDAMITTGVEVLVSIFKNNGDDGKWITRPQALAAAVEFFACELLGQKMPLKKELIKIYKTSLATLNKFYKIINKETGDINAD